MDRGRAAAAEHTVLAVSQITTPIRHTFFDAPQSCRETVTAGNLARADDCLPPEAVASANFGCSPTFSDGKGRLLWKVVKLTGAGAAALIDSASYNTASLTGNANSRDSRVVKAVLLNSADKTLGWSNGQIANPNGLGGVLTSQSLDWKVGAGRLNLDQAYDQYLSGTTDVAGTGGGLISELGWDYGEVNSGSVNDYLFTQALVGGSTFTATLSWMRDRAISGITASDLAQSDLNLVMFDATGGVYTVDISRSISLYNVVEHLSFVVPTTGLYGIRVDFPGMTFGTADSEAYGLAWSGTAVPEPATLAVVGVGFVAVLIRRRRG